MRIMKFYIDKSKGKWKLTFSKIPCVMFSYYLSVNSLNIYMNTMEKPSENVQIGEVLPKTSHI